MVVSKKKNDGMIYKDEAQKILDHFHRGRIKRFESRIDFYEAETDQGIFFILWDLPSKARESEKSRRDKLIAKVGQIERLLLPDYKGQLQEYSSYVHQGEPKGMYYSVYRLIK